MLPSGVSCQKQLRQVERSSFKPVQKIRQYYGADGMHRWTVISENGHKWQLSTNCPVRYRCFAVTEPDQLYDHGGIPIALPPGAPVIVLQESDHNQVKNLQ